jgi:roadblock/LC7 domain-containing protein
VLNTSAGARGGAWSADDRIILPLTGQSALSIVSAAGGTAEVLTKLEKGDTTHRWPEALPGGKAVLYVSAHSLTLFDDAQIMAVRLGTGERKVLVQGGTFPHYVPTGHLVYYRAGNIMAAPFDPESLEVKGSPVAVMEGVRSSGTGGAHFAVSNNGTLVYLPGSATGTARSTLVWVDRKGVSTPLNLPPHAFGASSGPKLSPDGKFAALLINEPTNDAWVYDLGRDTLTRLSFDGTPVFIAWSPDGKRIVYYSTKSGPTIFWKPADGSGAEEPLVKSDVQLFTGAFTPDGRIYIYSQNSPKTGRDIWYETVDDHKQHVFLQTPFNETAARFSPDGRYAAYLSDESGRNEIYVQPFPGPGGKYQISTEGGQEMAWGADGEIFYRNGDKMMAVPVKTQPSFEVGKPQLLFEAPYLQNHTGGGALYDVSRDGQRFLMLKPVESQATTSTQINMVLNWFEELKKKVPVK